MKMIVAAAALALAAPLALAVPAAAQQAAPLGLDSPIEALVADAKANAVLQANLPGIEKHPAYDMFKGMSLKQMAPYSQGQITEEMLAKIGKELAEAK